MIPYRRLVGCFIVACSAAVVTIPGVALAQEDDETAQTTDAGGSAAVETDEAWSKYQKAFLELARQDPGATVVILVRLRRDHPDHPAAVFARPVLEALRDHPDLPDGTVPAKDEWPDLSDHPAVKDRDSPVYDSTWAKYREAFAVLAKTNEDASVRRLRQLEQGTDHPTVAWSEELLEILVDGKSSGGDRTASTSFGTDESDEDEDDGGTTSRSSAEPMALRITAESLGSVTGFLAGGLVGGTVGLFIAITPSANHYTPLGYTILGAGILGLGTAPLGTYVAGNLVDGRGSLLGAYLGAMGGVAVDVILGLIGNASPLNAGEAALITTLQTVIPMAGSVIGYELTHEQPLLGSRDGASLRPTLGTPARGRGLTLGFDLRF